MNRALFLCGAPQSSGSTLISWCFLQRRDMNGVLDARTDLLRDIPTHIGQPFTWCKTTISAFRMRELVPYYQDAGWTVRPLLVLRDVRHVWASLCLKPYGRNGTTAEDPPLRLRLRRFKEDWEYFRGQGGVMIRYESFLAAPERVLRDACTDLGLAWDDAMLTWPKERSQIADTKYGNRTFRATRGRGLLDSLRSSPDTLSPGAIPTADLEWLEAEFAEFNAANNYPAQLAIARSRTDGERSVPSYEVTRRYTWDSRRKPLRSFMHRLGFRGRIREAVAGVLDPGSGAR